jgi:hypothetical protein
VASVILACATAVTGAQEQEQPCSDDTVPVWWADYREQGQEMGKVTGGGSAKRSDLSQADEEALEAAKRDLRDWMRRRFEEVALWSAQRYARDSDVVTPKAIEDFVDGLAEEYTTRCQTCRTASFMRCDGQTEVFVLVEVDVQAVPKHVAGRLIDEFLMGEVEDKVRSVLAVPESQTQTVGESLGAEQRPSDDTFPAWWAGDWNQDRGRSMLVGGGRAKHRDSNEARKEALDAAELMLGDLMKRHFDYVEPLLVSIQQQFSDSVPPPSIEDVVDNLINGYVEKCKRYRTESILRSDGRTEVYVLVSVDTGEVPVQAAQRLIEELTDGRPSMVPDYVHEGLIHWIREAFARDIEIAR